MPLVLADFAGKNPKRSIKGLTHEEKLELVDLIIDRDAAIWKRYNRERYCDFGYYFHTLRHGGVALSEKQR